MRVVVCSLADAPGSKLIRGFGGPVGGTAAGLPRTRFRSLPGEVAAGFAGVFAVAVKSVGTDSGATAARSSFPHCQQFVSCSMHSAAQWGHGILLTDASVAVPSRNS